MLTRNERRRLALRLNLAALLQGSVRVQNMQPSGYIGPDRLGAVPR